MNIGEVIEVVEIEPLENPVPERTVYPTTEPERVMPERVMPERVDAAL